MSRLSSCDPALTIPFLAPIIIVGVRVIPNGALQILSNKIQVGLRQEFTERLANIEE